MGELRAEATADVETWLGWRVDDVNGSMIGRVQSVRNDRSGRWMWLVIGEFRFGDGRRFVIPVRDAVGGSGRVWSPYPRQMISATHGMVGSRFTPQAERRLTSHYGRPGRADQRRAA